MGKIGKPARARAAKPRKRIRGKRVAIAVRSKTPALRTSVGYSIDLRRVGSRHLAAAGAAALAVLLGSLAWSGLFDNTAAIAHRQPATAAIEEIVDVQPGTEASVAEIVNEASFPPGDLAAVAPAATPVPEINPGEVRPAEVPIEVRPVEVRPAEQTTSVPPPRIRAAAAPPRNQGRHRRYQRYATASLPASGTEGTEPTSAVGSSPAGAAGFGGGDLVAQARQYIGTNPTGRRSLWCGAFMDMVLKQTGRRGGGNLARGYANYGTRIAGPEIGAIVVLGRKGGGHVGVVSGIDANGNPIVISGNHNRTVAESKYPRSRVIAYVRPNG